jgi:N-acetylmuramoyl-L-alanine amidase/putative methionine-R-sulfoxide reductase with GAF domain
MATIPTKPEAGATTSFTGAGAPAWPREQSAAAAHPGTHDYSASDDSLRQPSARDALQALLAFSALHEQVRRRKALAARHNGFETAPATEFGAPEFEPDEQFVLDEVLQLIAERAVAITGADGLAVALAENNEIVLRAAAGTVRPDVGARIDRDSAFSGASFRTAQVVMCDDTETDARVNLQACRRLGARSMVAVPLCGRRRVIGLLEAFSSWPFGFNDSDVRNLSLLAELVVGALRPEDEDRFAQSADVAATKLDPAARVAQSSPRAAVSSAVPAQAEAAPAVHRVETSPTPKTEPVPAKPVTPTSLAATTKPLDIVASAPAEILDQPAAAIQPAIGIKKEIKKEVEKDLGTHIESAIQTEIPEKIENPALKPEVAAEAAATDAAAVPELTFGRLPAARTTRPGLLILLLCVVVAVAFAAGVWWKLKNSQMGSAMITQKTIIGKTLAEKTAGNKAGESTPSAAPQSATPSAATPENAANAASDSVTDANESATTPATPQELAKFPRVTGIRHWSSATSSTVVLDLEDQVQYEAHRLASPERIYFDLRDTQLTPEAAKSVDVTGDALLNRVRVAQTVAGMTRVVLETRTDSNFSVSLEPNPYRLVIEVRKVGVSAKNAVNLFPNAEAEKNRLAIVVPPPTKEDLQLRARVPNKMRIVVDAGHGGWDLGTVGRRGLLEKDLVLEIAQRLGKLLESRLGAEVIYTRQDDNYIPLDDRAGIANQAQADLFVSVHANYSDLPSARGVETYYTNTFSAPGSKESGTSKTADANVTIGAKTNPLLSPADLHERIEQSRRLAASVQRSLYGTLVVQNPGLRDRGIKEAGFVVLTESAMPGILAEVSFVSSPTDEQKLRSDGYREQIAEALYKGIARYAASSKGIKVASTGK